MNREKKIVIVSFVLLVVFYVMAGCATTDYTIKEKYVPISRSMVNANRYKIYIETEFSPTKTENPKLIGVKKNGYGWETANVFLDPSPESWLRESLSAEFRKAGFTLVEEKGANAVSVKVHAKQLFVEPGVGFWSADLTAIAILKVEVILPDSGRKFQRKFVGMDSESEMIWLDSDFSEKFIKSAQMSISQVVEGIHQLLSKVLS